MSGREDDITAWFREQRQLDLGLVPIGIGDDMAMVNAGGTGVLITTDMLLDGTHFDLEKASLEQVGYKAMAVNLSDCAAMASLPLAAVVSVALPLGFKADGLKELHKGIMRAADKYGCSLVGGDITSWKRGGGFAISVAMLSRPGEAEPVLRSGAKAGDVICVTGDLGGSDLGKHLEFEPRVEEALKLAGLVRVNAMMDLSDGVSSDLGRICRASGVGAVVYEDKLPVSAAAKGKANPISAAVNDGEDFELLFTLSEGEYNRLIEKWDDDLKISFIGRIVEGGDVKIVSASGEERVLRAGGYDHFSSVNNE